MKDLELGLLLRDSGLLGTQDFIGCSSRELNNRNVSARVILDLNRRAVEAMKEIRGTGGIEGKLEILIVAFRYFQGTTTGPEDIMP